MSLNIFTKKPILYTDVYNTSDHFVKITYFLDTELR